MGTIHIHLEEGFDHDRVEVDAGGDELVEPDATTRHQIGLAAVLELTAPDGEPCRIRVGVPRRRLLAEATVDPAVWPHVRVSIRGGSLLVEPATAPPMLA